MTTVKRAQSPQLVKLWITKYATTTGGIVGYGKLMEDTCGGPCHYASLTHDENRKPRAYPSIYNNIDWYTSAASALLRVEEMFDNTRKQLERKIARLDPKLEKAVKACSETR